ncbi:Gfo/Idh/MocA family oxidoreductase [Yimella sp. cx-573]|nr:Gfo/Idh/MocA family oxidoreductase [Yimella sp. cx-573]
MTVIDPREAPALRWGVIAPGGIARTFAHAVRSATRSTVVAVGSRDAGRAAAFAQEFDIPRSYGDYASVAADQEVEAVYVASPHSEHRDHALLALRTGKPVLVEKALARNEREVHQMFAAAEEANLFAMEAMWTRFLPHIDWVRSRIAAGAIGEVVTVTADHGQSLDLPDAHRLKNPDLAGGALLDLGVYPISFAVDLLGAPAEVKALGALTNTRVDGHASAVLQYDAKVLAQIDTTLWTRTPTTAVVSGTEGSIEIDSDFYQPTTAQLRRPDKDRTVVEEFDGRLEGGFQFQIAEVARCVTAGRTQSERVRWDSSRAVMRVMDEIRRQIGVVYPGE